ncbi:spore germination protein [Paenibacillaceae bacterium]|nr:spore germination protein [Paenibacillaceae bacterium]
MHNKQSKETLISSDSIANNKRLAELMQNADDLMITDISPEGEQPITVSYVKGLTDEMKLERLILLHSQHRGKMLPPYEDSTPLTTLEEAAAHLALGYSVLLFPAEGRGVAICTLGVQLRNVEEPTSESVLKGARSGFTEALQNNIALVRYHFPSTSLKVEYLQIGRLSKLNLAVLSLSGLTNPEIVQELIHRLNEIPADTVVGSNEIEEWITDNRGTMFPLIESTERPDRVIGALQDGRVALMIQGTPFVSMLPFTFLQAFQVSEDYNWNYYIGSLIRLLRLLSGFLGLFLPAFYVATVTFHHELLPTPLLQSIASAKEPVPFPAVMESFTMMIAFEIMREAGVRMPRQIGQAVSIVGALILGQAAVQAGIVSPIMVIVAALTGICTFTLPPTTVNYVIRILQFVMTLLASMLGYVGIMIGMIMLMTHMASLRSFGVPYLSPAAPFDLNGLTDVVVRRPHTYNNKVPRMFRPLKQFRFRSKRG